MMLSSTVAGIEWLRQFDGRDVHVARLMLDLIKPVSFEEFEQEIIRLVGEIVAETSGRIAIFPVSEPPDERRPGSDGRVAHMLTRLEALHHRRLRVNQSVESMRAEKTKHIVFVDDIVGSGRRLGTFWRDWANDKKSVVSWLSSGHCKVWLVSYVAYQNGITQARRKMKGLKVKRVRSALRLTRLKSRRLWPSHVLNLMAKIAAKTKRAKIPFGFAGLCCPIVFQYGAPNNCPVALWSRGPEYEPIFPERAVPPSAYPAFHGQNPTRSIETLWDARQYRLALALIDEMQGTQKRSQRYLQLVTMLGLLNRGLNREKLGPVLLMRTAQVEELLLQAQQLALVDSDFRLTQYGTDILSRTRRGFLKMPVSAPATPVQQYLPKSFCGAQ